MSYADFLVGASEYPGFTFQGRAYVYLGSAGDLSATPCFHFDG